MGDSWLLLSAIPILLVFFTLVIVFCSIVTMSAKVNGCFNDS